jgi:mono/diheme cytochrome c family protein
MRAPLVVATVVLLAAGAVRAEDPDPRLARGKKLMGEVSPRCTICHSVEGRGNPKGPLDDVGNRWRPEDLKSWLKTPAEMAKKHGKTRKPAMLPYAELTDAELDDLAAYLASLKTAAAR